MKRTLALPAALALALTLVLAGCGSDDGPDDGVASANGTGSGKDSDDVTSEEDRQAAGLKFAKCMREHGIEMEDPKGGRIGIKSAPGQDETMEKAQEACQQYLPKISEADRKKADERGLEFAQCMRKNGVEEFPDPEGGMMRMNEGIADDPDFEQAQEACQDLIGGPGLRSGKGA
jgi:hypothetical protein